MGTDTEFFETSATQDADNLALLEQYLSLGPPHNQSLLSLTRVPVRLLDAAQRHNLPLVEKQILHDMSQLPSGWSQNFSTRGGALVAQDVPVVTFNALGRSAGGEPAVEDGKTVRLNQRRMQWVSVGDTLRKIIEGGSATPGQIAFPPALVLETADLDDTQRLGDLWDAFTLDQTSAPDTETTLRFLHLLAAPTPPAPDSLSQIIEADGGNIRLALRILQSFPSHLLPSIESPPPSTAVYRTSGAPLSPLTNAQFVLLRTIVSIAIGYGHPHLAGPSLLSLGQMRSSCLNTREKLVSDDFEISSSIHIIKDLMNQSYLARQKSYRPPKQDVEYLSLSHQLLTSVIPPIFKTYRLSLDEALSSVLNTFAIEAAGNQRWDLLRNVFARWSTGSTERQEWLPSELRTPLLRWLVGDASYRHYGAATEWKDSHGHSPRLIDADTFEELARDTLSTLRSSERTSQRDSILRWTLERKAEWIELLCSSRASTAISSELARCFYDTFLEASPLGSQKPFAMPSSAVLTLLESSTAPRHTSFARSLIDHHLAVLTSPHSPFACERSTIEHFDLSTFAQAYALVGDYTSYEQVYRRLIAQRMVPDRHDLHVALATTVAFDLEQVKVIVRKAVEMRLPLKVESWKMIFHALVKANRTRTDDWGDHVRDKVYTLLNLAREVGLRARSFEIVREYARSIIEGKIDEETGNIVPAPTAIRTSLRRMARQGKQGSAIHLYRDAIKRGLADERALQLVLDFLCHGGREKDDLAQEALPEFIDHAVLKSPTLIRSTATLELALHGCALVGDARAAEKLLRFASKEGVVNEQEMQEKLAVLSDVTKSAS